MTWYLNVWKNYFNFSGRARRKEYWMFYLVNICIMLAMFILIEILGPVFETISGPLLAIYSIAILVPSLAVLVRRLHDIGKSGWMLLVGFIPIVGGIWLLVMVVSAGDIGPNAFGNDPKETGAIGY